MPARVIAISAVSPDRISTGIKTQLAVEAVPVGGLSAAVRRANFAINPERGGRPEMTRPQPMNATPRMPIVAGIATPRSSKSSELVFFAVNLSGHREHVRARLTASLDEFNQKKERAQAKCRTNPVE